MNCREYHGPTCGHDNCPCCPRCGIDLVHESPNGYDCLCTQQAEDREREIYEERMYEQYCIDMRNLRDKEISEHIVDSFTTG